jgi:ammonium transporter, Amt family
VPYIGTWIERTMRVDDVVVAVAVHGSMGFLALIWVGIFAAGYPTGVNNVDSSIWGQLLGVATFLPLGFLSGWVASWIMKKLNILRVPPAVELEGLDSSSYDQDLYLPEVASPGETIYEPDGTLVPSAPVLLEESKKVVV